jgi:Fur family iron response transcriptional regulator
MIFVAGWSDLRNKARRRPGAARLEQVGMIEMDHATAIQNAGPSSGPVVRAMLRTAGLRPTRQRMALASILFAQGNRHISAERLHEEAMSERVPVSLATIYNTLHQFTEAGLLREVIVDGSRTYFDTNTSDHQHFFIEGENKVIDIEGDNIGVDHLPAIPAGMEIARIDVVIRLRKLGAR